MTEKKDYTEDGKYEVKELSIKHNGETFHAVVAMDFNLMRKAMAEMVQTDVVKTGKGPDDVKVNVSTDPMAAGDKVLFLGWKEGDEVIRKRMILRSKAARILGAWVQELTADDEDEQEEEKKN